MNRIIKNYKIGLLLIISIFLISVIFINNQISYKCHNLCITTLKIQNNFIQMQLKLNKTKLANKSINLILNNKYYLNTKTNENASLKIYMPLKLGYNELIINSKNGKADIYFTYLTSFVNLLYILISILILLLIRLVADVKFNSKRILLRTDSRNNKINKTPKLIEITIKEMENIIKKIIISINKNKLNLHMAVDFKEIKNEFCKILNIENSYLIDDELWYLLRLLENENVLKIYNEFICMCENMNKELLSRFVYDKSLYEDLFENNKNILITNSFVFSNNIKIKNIKIIIKNKNILRIADFNSLTNKFKFMYNKNSAIFLFLELNNYIEVYAC